VECKLVQPLWKAVWRFLKNLKIYPTYDPMIKRCDICICKYMYVHTMEFYSAIRENEIMSFSCKYMELEDIMLSEERQIQKVKGHMFSLICRR
jgi:hypothetical protein